MLPFVSLELQNCERVVKAVAESGYAGSDANFVNIYLLRKKYGTLVAVQDGFCECTCECREAAWAERSEDEKSRLAEYCAICEAIDHFDTLGMIGAVLYVGGASIGAVPSQALIELVKSGLGEKILEYAKEHPYIIKEYRAGFPIIYL